MGFLSKFPSQSDKERQKKMNTASVLTVTASLLALAAVCISGRSVTAEDYKAPGKEACARGSQGSMEKSREEMIRSMSSAGGGSDGHVSGGGGRGGSGSSSGG